MFEIIDNGDNVIICKFSGKFDTAACDEHMDRFESSKLFSWIILVVNATSVHDTFSVEQLEVGGNKYPILLHSFGANLFTIIGVWDEAVNSLVLQHVGQLGQVFVHNEPVILPHRGL